MDAARILAAAEKLITDALARSDDGLTNAEVGEATGLNPPIEKQRGYVTWTLLQDMRRRGIVERIGSRYRLKQSA
jgi:DNA-binding IclR family transcriptional regulator